jgi:hypothetical protein
VVGGTWARREQRLEMDERNRNAGGKDRGTAVQWLLSDKHSKLLPTPWLTP